MNSSKGEIRKPSPIPRAVLFGLIAGIAAGYVSYLFAGVLGFVVGFVVGALVASRTILLTARAKEEKQ